MRTEYRLAYGTHANPQDGRCAMEWVSYLAGEPHSDQPACVSPVLRAFCIALNDGLEDSARQRLRPYLTRTIGTADDGLDEARSWLAMDWLIRVYTPSWLEFAQLCDPAGRLRALAPILDVAALHTALAPLELARREARAAWTVAAGAARAVPWAAGRSAAHETAWGSAGAAVWAAARVAVGDIAGDRARAAARAAAGDAAAAAARTARTARTEAGHAARKQAERAALAPTLGRLQDLAVDLLDRMLPTEPLVLLSGPDDDAFSATAVPAAPGCAG